jgi:hypothetical protein
VKPPTVLHYFRCRVCASILITGIKATNYEPCNGCRSYMRFMFSEPVETLEQQATAKEVAKRGKVFRWSPGPEPLKHTPAKRSTLPPPLLTPEQIEEAKRRRDALWAEEEARMEAAYKAAEEANR